MENSVKNNEIQHSFDEYQHSIIEFEKKVEVFQEDMETMKYMEATLDNSLAFLKEKGLLDEFYLYSLRNGTEEYRTMVINHSNKNKEA